MRVAIEWSIQTLKPLNMHHKYQKNIRQAQILFQHKTLIIKSMHGLLKISLMEKVRYIGGVKQLLMVNLLI